MLGIDRATLFTRLREPMSPEARDAYDRLLEARARAVPVAYLIGTREFMGLSFEVGPGVLVPRPETEILVEWAIDWLRDRTSSTVIDVGTGSGAIGLSIAAAIGPERSGRIIVTDISPEAICIAARNRQHLGLDRQVAIVQGSLVSWLDDQVDLLVANLPYLRPDQIAANPQLAAEPLLALDGGADGLDLIRALIADAPRVITPGGAVGLEIAPEQRDTVISLAKKAFPGSEITILRDLAGLDRHIVVQTLPPDRSAS